MPENEEPDLQIPEDASSLECSAIVIPAAYIDRPNSEAPLSGCSNLEMAIPILMKILVICAQARRLMNLHKNRLMK